MANLFRVAVLIDSADQMIAGIQTPVFQRLAPVALFVFKRPEHTRRMLEALAHNPEFERSPLFIFCDGARHNGEAASVEAARAVVRKFDHPAKTIIEAPHNRGLANSVVHGVSDLCDKFGHVIVVEDDLIVSRVFLHYMNYALEHYRDEQSVMQVSGHMFPVDLQVNEDAVFLPFTTSWGWATWQRAWTNYSSTLNGMEMLRTNKLLRMRFNLDGSYPYYSMLKRQLNGEIDSWAIRWYLSCFRLGGITLYPSRSLITNDGFDGSGTHCGAVKNRDQRDLLPVSQILHLPHPSVDLQAFDRVKSYLRMENHLFARLARRVKRQLA